MVKFHTMRLPTCCPMMAMALMSHDGAIDPPSQNFSLAALSLMLVRNCGECGLRSGRFCRRAKCYMPVIQLPVHTCQDLAPRELHPITTLLRQCWRFHVRPSSDQTARLPGLPPVAWPRQWRVPSRMPKHMGAPSGVCPALPPPHPLCRLPPGTAHVQLRATQALGLRRAGFLGCDRWREAVSRAGRLEGLGGRGQRGVLSGRLLSRLGPLPGWCRRRRGRRGGRGSNRAGLAV